MSKITIRNDSKSVKVLKALGLMPLRLFPGHNYVDKKDLDKYFVSVAAEGIRKECLSVVGEPSKEQLKEAEKAKKKNDEFNKAYRVLEAKNILIKKGKDAAIDQENIIKEQGEKLATQEKTMAELLKKVEALEALEVKPEAKPEPKEKKGK